MTTATTTVSFLSSPPKHNNPQLEKNINQNKNKSSLDLSSSKLVDEDMCIVGYYLLVNNKVSLFVVIVKIEK